MNRSSIPKASSSGPIFRLSTFRNEDVLISESMEHIPLVRVFMIIVCVIFGIITLTNLIITYRKYRLMLEPGVIYRTMVPLILFLNILFHVSHYSHNIYDPAAYFEPKYLYQKIFITEMEPTFLFNFPLSVVFLIATQKLLLCCTNQQSKPRSMLILVTLYSSMSIISGGHYIDEPPSNFSLFCNITIAGEAIIAFVLLVIALFVYRSSSSEIIIHKYTRLATNDTSNIQMSVSQQRPMKSKSSDNESL